MRGFIEQNPHLACPYIIHGDEAPISKHSNRAIRVLQWSSPVSRVPTLEKKLVIAMNYSQDPLVKAQQNIIDGVAVWSFTQCLANAFPTTDHAGKHLCGARARLGSRPLHPGGVILVFTGSVGDWEWHLKTLSLTRHYNTIETCELCMASKLPGDLNLANALQEAGWTNTHRRHEDFIEEHRHAGTLHCFCEIPGWHINNIFEDVLHDDLLGVRLHACGGALFELAAQGHWRTEHHAGWQGRLDAAMDMAWSDFVSWLRARGLSCSTSKFSHRVLSMHRQMDWPCLKAKAANCALVCDWLADVAIAAAESEPSIANRSRCVMLWGFKELWRLFHVFPTLSAGEAQALEKARTCALLGYHACSRAAQDRNEFVYPIQPKFHKLDHLCRRAVRTKVSPSTTWTFSDEDSMTWMSRLCSALHGSTLARTPCDRWLLSFFALRI